MVQPVLVKVTPITKHRLGLGFGARPNQTLKAALGSWHFQAHPIYSSDMEMWYRPQEMPLWEVRGGLTRGWMGLEYEDPY